MLTRNREAFEAAWGHGDTRALGALMAAHVVAGSDGGALTIGRDAMEQAYTSLFAGPMRGTTRHITVESTDAIRPDVTVSCGRYEVRRGGEVLERSRFMTLHEQAGGAWRIRSMQTFTPAAAPTR